MATDTQTSPTMRREQLQARRMLVLRWLQLSDDAQRLIADFEHCPEGTFDQGEYALAHIALVRVWEDLADHRPHLPARSRTRTRLKGGA